MKDEALAEANSAMMTNLIVWLDVMTLMAIPPLHRLATERLTREE